MFKKIIFTVVLVFVGWLLSVEFAFSAESVGRFGGITDEYSSSYRYCSISNFGGINRDIISVLRSDSSEYIRVDADNDSDIEPENGSGNVRKINEQNLYGDAGDSNGEQPLCSSGAYFESYFGYTPTDAELDIFYRTVMAECGYTEPDEGVRAVCDVIANRVRSPRFPDTLTGVLFQRNQFETVATGRIYNYEVTDRVRRICDEQIRNGVSYEGILFFTAGGYNEYCEPAFVIGNHYFGY